MADAGLTSAVRLVCPISDERLEEYHFGRLSPHDTEAITVHLAGCDGCRSAQAELVAFIRALAEAVANDL
jgi:anti-sigma factor RsiW